MMKTVPLFAVFDTCVLKTCYCTTIMYHVLILDAKQGIFCCCVGRGAMTFHGAHSMQPNCINCHHHHHHQPQQLSVHSFDAPRPSHPQLSSSTVNTDAAFTPLIPESSQHVCVSSDSQQPTNQYVASLTCLLCLLTTLMSCCYDVSL